MNRAKFCLEDLFSGPASLTVQTPSSWLTGLVWGFREVRQALAELSVRRHYDELYPLISLGEPQD